MAPGKQECLKGTYVRVAPRHMGDEGADVQHEERGNQVVWKKAETSHDTYTGGCPSHTGETGGQGSMYP